MCQTKVNKFHGACTTSARRLTGINAWKPYRWSIPPKKGVVPLRVSLGGGRLDSLRCRLGDRHVALAIEETSGVDHQAGSVDVTQHQTVFLDFDALAGVDRAFNLAGDADQPRVDFRLELSLVRHDDGSLARDFALEVGIEANYAGGKLQLAIHLNSRLKQAHHVIVE